MRDLILKRVPKDYDVITTAKLSEVFLQLFACLFYFMVFVVGHVTEDV